MGSAVLASKGLRQSPPPAWGPASLLPVTSDPSQTPHSSSRVFPRTVATELETMPPLAASPKPHGLQGTGRGLASAEKLAVCILGLQKIRDFARCVSSSIEKTNVSEMVVFLTQQLLPRRGFVPELQERKACLSAQVEWAGPPAFPPACPWWHSWCLCQSHREASGTVRQAPARNQKYPTDS